MKWKRKRLGTRKPAGHQFEKDQGYMGRGGGVRGREGKDINTAIMYKILKKNIKIKVTFLKAYRKRHVKFYLGFKNKQIEFRKTQHQKGSSGSQRISFQQQL